MEIKKNSLVQVGVVGARGYSGQELCRLLFNHPNVSFDSIFFNEGKSFSLWNEFPDLEREAQIQGKPEPQGHELAVFFKSQLELDVVFLATPNEVSLELAPQFLNKGISVIDLSGVFRLNKGKYHTNQELYLNYYGIEQNQPELLNRAHYGLRPFSQMPETSIPDGPFLVSNPGCYVTSVLMGLLPLLKDGVIDPKSIIVDAKSGASGAGKKLNESLLFSELYGDFYPYKVLNHQHKPEIEMYLDFFSGQQSSVVFTPHLLPIFRGLLSTCYLKWSRSFTAFSIEEKKARILECYQKYYHNYPLVQFGEFKKMQKKLTIKAIAQSCMTHIAFDLDSENLIVIVALDNLLKGASSQAVENLNYVYGFPLQESLI